MKKIEPLPWRGIRAIDKIILALLFLAAVAVLTLPFLDMVFIRRLARLTGAREVLAWLVNDYGAWIVGAALLGLTLLYAVWVRHRMIGNRNLWFGTGCPSCMERELVRVSRNSSDRFYGLFAIPAYRYACRNCTWRGLRIARREHSREHDAEMEAALLRFTPDGTGDFSFERDSNPEEPGIPSTVARTGPNSLFRDPGDVAYLDEAHMRQLIDDFDVEDGIPADESSNHVEDESGEEMEWLWQRSTDE
ncbi:MAG TPA: hypothetical protein PKE20_14450 [Promineifilum sp.]|nr:hypothetical protein [Promineifilum sp.]